MPTDVKELDAFWIGEFAQKPKKIQSNQSSDTEEEEVEVPDTADDRRTLFDEQEQNDSQYMRLCTSYTPTVFSSQKFWLALVPHLAVSQLLSARALAILHRGVLPHGTLPIQLMDWIAGCVDHESRSIVSPKLEGLALDDEERKASLVNEIAAAGVGTKKSGSAPTNTETSAKWMSQKARFNPPGVFDNQYPSSTALDTRTTNNTI
ncbi:hypothetical protein FRB96_001066 [Tulasnella sp. 330]|nr:hypothetical protein FRB96_001066 [Tulasnella sp. 330]